MYVGQIWQLNTSTFEALCTVLITKDIERYLKLKCLRNRVVTTQFTLTHIFIWAIKITRNIIFIDSYFIQVPWRSLSIYISNISCRFYWVLKYNGMFNILLNSYFSKQLHLVDCIPLYKSPPNVFCMYYSSNQRQYSTIVDYLLYQVSLGNCKSQC